MIKVLFTDNEVRFESENAAKQYAIRQSEHPEVLGHPRHLMVNFESALPVLHAALKAVNGRSLFAPEVEVHVLREMPGGLADVDKRTLKDFLFHSGARDVRIRDTQS
jgi:hypothetical protein